VPVLWGEKGGYYCRVIFVSKVVGASVFSKPNGEEKQKVLQMSHLFIERSIAWELNHQERERVTPKVAIGIITISASS